MTTNSSFVSEVQKWVENDNEIDEYNKKIKELSAPYVQKIKQLKEENKALEPHIISHVVTNKIGGIKISDGKLNIVSSSTSTTLSFKFMRECLVKFFHQHNNPNAEMFADNIIEYTKAQRDTKKTVSLKRS